MDTIEEASVPESALVPLAVLGDLEAFNELVLNYQDLVDSWARSILADGDSAEDAAQETFVSAIEIFFQNFLTGVVAVALLGRGSRGAPDTR